MKKLLSAILAVAAVVSACQEPKDMEPAIISFLEPQVSEGVVTIMLSVSNYSSSEAASVPVTFEGTAVKGVDYTVSSEAFTVGGAAPMLAININPIKLEGSTVKATLTAQDGFAVGENSSVSITLDEETFGSIGFVSFWSEETKIGSMGEITMFVTDDEDYEKELANDTQIAVEVTGNSTAVLGEHFEFVGGPYALVPGGEYEGIIRIKVLKYEEGKNTIELQFNDARFGEGWMYPTIMITIEDIYSKLDGEWVINELIMDRDAYAGINYMLTEEELAEYPEFNSADKIRFDVDNGKFYPSFQSKFKRYFIGEANMQSANRDYVITLSNDVIPENQSVLLVSLDNVNRYFSETEFSEDKQGYIGVTFIEGDNEEELLDFYVIDYTSHSFAQSYLDIYDKEKPVATGCGHYIRMTFKRAE